MQLPVVLAGASGTERVGIVGDGEGELLLAPVTSTCITPAASRRQGDPSRTGDAINDLGRGAGRPVPVEKVAVVVAAVAPLGVILTVPALLTIESAAEPVDVGTAETVTVPAYTEAPVGAMLTVPSPLTIESTVVLADVGSAETVTKSDSTEAPPGVILTVPALLTIESTAAAGRRGHRRDRDRAR